MVLHIYATVEGTNQGTFNGEGTGRQKNKIPGVAFAYSVGVAHDSTGDPSGKRQHQPIVFTKEWGASSPQFYQAAFTNETLKSVLFEFFTLTADGKERVDHTFKLTNASIGKVGSRCTLGRPAARTSIPDSCRRSRCTFRKLRLSAFQARRRPLMIGKSRSSCGFEMK